ncbi:MAG: orotidine-5'-phosphate decarboxylase [Pseudomonadota bacterium]
MNAIDRLIIALDVPHLEDAKDLVARIGNEGTFYKIGYQLFPIGGYSFARDLVERGKKVFLDAKLFDIGATVERGVKSLTSIGAHLLTVHADTDTIKGAITGRGDDENLQIFAVTVLTSWDQMTVASHAIDMPVLDLVLFRADIAAEAGADGVIASAAEATAIKARFGDRLQIVTPGIRPQGVAAHDQKRVITPEKAILAGADRLVVGRPITQSADPAIATATIIQSIKAISP